MHIFHDFYDNDSLDCLMTTTYSINQAVNRSDRTRQMMTRLKEKMIMRAHGQATVWEIHVGIGRARPADGRWQQLRRWWAARRDARRRATLAALNSCWDSQRESLQPSRADAAPEMAAAQGALSMAIMLYGFTR
jgi:hypothetical protein